ncbi:MAG: sugar transferase [Anaerovibrio sp.]
MERYPYLRKLFLLAGDIAIIILSVWLAVQLVNGHMSFSLNTEIYYRMLPINVAVLCIAFGIYGLYTLPKKSYGEIFIGIALSVLYAFIFVMAASFFLREFAYSRSILSLATVFELLLLNGWQYLWWQLERRLDVPKDALLVGSNEECERVLKRLSVVPQMNYHVCHILPLEAERQEWENALANADLAIICQDVKLKTKAQIVSRCQQLSKQVMLVPSVYEMYCSGLEISRIDDIPFFRPQYLNPSLERRSIKRIMDVLLSCVILLAALLPMAVIALIIRLDSKGPVFYKQERVGRYGKTFEVYKFRSMRQDAEALSGPVLAGEDDPRITRAGRVLRAMRLDELPQLINVLKGDMSIVGPRPERPFFVEQFKAEIPEYEYRHNVRPGITGMAQVNGKYNTTVYDKLVYDLMYVQKCDIFTDLVILVQTVRVLFMKSSTEGV